MKKLYFGKIVTSASLAIIMSVALMTGCSSGDGPKQTAEAASAEETSAVISGAKSEEASEVSSKAESAVKAEAEASPKVKETAEGKIQAVLHTSSGEEFVLDSSNDSKAELVPLASASSRQRAWIDVRSIYTSTTLMVDGYDYSGWNMLDWDKTTCWAEGEARSEGLWENFTYYFYGTTRIDGFRIYPGYQKNQRIFRKNVFPAGLEVTAGGYTFNVNLDPWLRDLEYDDDYFWIDITFDEPVYDDKISAMIIAVGTTGSNPDSDCCISEFHAFCY